MRDTGSAAKRSGTAAAVVTGVLVTAAALFLFYIGGLSRVPRVRLDGQFHLSVYRAAPAGDAGRDAASGSKAEGGAGQSGSSVSAGQDAAAASGEPLRAGDRLVAETVLHPLDRMEDAALAFHVRDAHVTVSLDGETRAVFGAEESATHRETGEIVARIPLADEDWGRTLKIELLLADGEAEAALRDVYVLPEVEAVLYPLIGHETKFFAFTGILLAGALLLVLSLVRLVTRGRASGLLMLSLLLLAGGTAVYGRSGFFGLFLTRARVSAHAGTCALFFAPAAFSFFQAVSYAPHKKIRRRIYLLCGLLFAAAAAAVFALHAVRGIHPAGFVRPAVYVFAGFLLLMLLIERGSLARSAREEKEDVLPRAGMRCMLFSLLIEIAKWNLFRVPQLKKAAAYLPETDYAAAGFLALAGLLLLYEERREARFVRHEENVTLMQRLAYTDILTTIPNRHYCDRKIHDIAKPLAFQSTPAEYTMFMIDVDSLGEVNEAHGFDAGDEMIRFVAEALSDAMRGCGVNLILPGGVAMPAAETGENGDCFFGRWGGDEFVACTYRAQADAFLTTFTSRIAAINIEKRAESQVSVSVGSCDFRSGSMKGVMRALTIADRAMLDRKAQFHEAHKTLI